MSKSGTSRLGRAVDAVHHAVLDLVLEQFGSPMLGAVYARIASLCLPRVVTLSVAGTSAQFRVTNGIEYSHVARYDHTPDFPVLVELLSDIHADDVFWDVGANVGIHTCFAAGTIDTGTVVAFEPNPKNARRIRENLELNDRSGTVTPCALSSTEGTTELRVNTVDTVGAFGRLEAAGGEAGATVETKTGDGLVAAGELPSPSVVKVDVQGSEFDVLRGMERCLTDSECRRLYCNAYRKHFDTQEEGNRLQEFLDGCGFDVSKIGGWTGGYFLRATKGSEYG